MRRSHVLIILTLFFLTSRQAHTGEEFSFDIGRKGIVHVGELSEGGEMRWLGTGFLVDEACTFTTAKHVLASAKKEKLVLRFQRPQERGMVLTHPVRVLYEDSEADIAFLRIDKVGNFPCHSRSLYIFKLASEVPTSGMVGSSVLIIGHPVLGDQNIDIPVLRKGVLSSVEIQMKAGMPALLLDLLGVPGFSGSPVILERTGEVVGIVYGPGPTPRGFGFEWATPITRRHYEMAVTNK